MYKKYFLLLIISITGILFLSTSFAQKNKKKDNPSITTIADSVKTCKKYVGLFTIYQDTLTGSTFILIKNEHFQKEYIYFSQIIDGIANARLIRGSFLDNKIFTIQKYFNKIEFITENTSYYFDPNTPLSKAASANISKATMVSEEIIIRDSINGEYLIKSNSIFLTELLQQIKPSPPSEAEKDKQFSLGNLNKEKTKYISINNYPLNTDVEVEYVYENPYPTVYGGEDISDSRYISIKIHHSLIEVPKNDFKPRYDDPRVGYFTHQVTDMTSISPTPYVDVIHRWNLVKKDKNAPLSEPVEPIVWWIENTTPVEFREVIKKATLSWNEAFEEAGFKNAMVVKVQPDDANWNAGDIRYNVLRWTSSPNPAFGGYGPSFVNPKTGQIIGADVMLEFVYFTNRVKVNELFENISMEEKTPDDPRFIHQMCSYGDRIHHNNLFGLAALNSFDLPDIEKKELLYQSIYSLILHELGHTLGLNHNMKASQLHLPSAINNKEVTGKTGLTGSVMDYAPVNIALNKQEQGLYYDIKPGPYDKWAIQFGYSPALEDTKAETARLQKLLEKSTDPSLAFGNDADDMRSSGYGIDPRVMVDDLSGDAITYAIDRIRLVNMVSEKLKEKYTKSGQSFHELRNAYLILSRQYFNAVTVISRYIGGVYVDRAFAGQQNASTPLTPVNYKDQKRAMTALNNHLFGIDAFKTNQVIYNYLQIQRRGFEHYGNNEDPKIHDWVLNTQKSVLDQLLHVNVLKRIVDTKLYGNEYYLTEYMDDLTNGLFKDDLKTNVNTFRQNIQLEYITRLIAIASTNAPSVYNFPAQSLALYHLKNIQSMLAVNANANTETKAHRQLILYKIEKALERK